MAVKLMTKSEYARHRGCDEKAVRKAIVGGDKAAAQSVFRTSMSTIDSIADKKIIHKNKAARHKSRLSAAVKSMAA